MSMPLPGLVPQITTPPIRKTPVTCCGYTSLMGTLQSWTCPGCQKVHEPPPQ